MRGSSNSEVVHNLIFSTLWLRSLCFVSFVYIAHKCFSQKMVLINLIQSFQRTFDVTSATKIYTKMWELWVHQDYDHLYIPLTSK